MRIRPLSKHSHPDLLVRLSTCEDAAVFRAVFVSIVGVGIVITGYLFSVIV